MARKIDTKKLLEERFVKINDDLENLKPGSTEYDLLLRNLCEVQSKLTDIKKASDTAEDNKLKREETKRMNDEELKFKERQMEYEEIRIEETKRMNDEDLKFKERQMEHEETRIVYDYEARKKQYRGNLIIDLGRLFFAGIGEAAYAGRWKRAMDLEYHASDQTNVIPPASINRMLTERKPKINNF